MPCVSWPTGVRPRLPRGGRPPASGPQVRLGRVAKPRDTVAFSHSCSLSLPRSCSCSHHARAKPSTVAIAAELRHALSLPPPHHHPLHLAHSSAIISSTSPNCLCHHPSSGEATVRVCHRCAIAGAPPSLCSPCSCSTEPSRSHVPLVRVRLELGLTQGKSLRLMLASSEQNTAVLPLRSCHHARGQASPLLH